MKDKAVYEAVSRVASNGGVIGFMVCPVGKKSQEIYMSSEVISFGLQNNSFEVKDVKLSNNGKPRGCNGFLLSKLPVIETEDEGNVNIKLYRVLLYIVRELGIKEDIKKAVKFTKIGMTASCSVTIILDEFKDMDLTVANRELEKNLKFYHKHMPKEMKGVFDKVKGTVEEKGYTVVTVSSLLVKGVIEK